MRCWLRRDCAKAASGRWKITQQNAPHIQSELVAEWAHPYSREVLPYSRVRGRQYWPTVKRLDDVYGDRNLFCSRTISDYQ